MASKENNLIGKKIGMLTIISEVEPHRYPDGRPRRKFLCRCDCGNEKSFMINLLKSGNTKSCGCYRIGITTKLKFSHGGCRERLYMIWRGMNQRCYSKSCEFYYRYGGRGLKVCDEWKEYSKFREWANASGYSDTLSIERRDIDKGYEPSNCYFIPVKMQANNRKNTIWISICGERKNLMQWCNELNIIYGSANARYQKGLSDYEILQIA